VGTTKSTEMKLRVFFLTFCCMTLFIIGCNEENSNKNAESVLYSKWQSLNEPGLVIEFSKNHKYCVFRNQNLVFEIPLPKVNSKNNRIEYLFVNDSLNLCPLKIEVEVVSNERIRVFFWKHHNILKDADEFHRTKSFNGFDSIMKIIQSNKE